MPLGLALIFVGICVAVLVNSLLGILLVLLGVFLMLAPTIQ